MNEDKTITLFSNITDKVNPQFVSPESIIQRIKSGIDKALIERVRNETDNKKRADLKGQLPCICWSGTFSERNDKSMIEHSGFVCLDFDHLPDAEDKKLEVSVLPYVYAAFISPSGDGLKVIVRVPKDISKHRGYYRGLLKRFPELDTTSINESRVCYSSYDENLLYYPDAKEFTEYIAETIPTVEEKRPVETKNALNTDYRKLEVVANMVRNAPDGEKHNTLLKAAKLLGGYIANGMVEESEGRRVVENEIQKRDINDFDAAKKCIADGIAYGKQSPINVAESHLVNKNFPQFLFASEGTKYLTEQSFGYKILLFKYNRDIKDFILTSLYWDEVRNLLNKAGFAKRRVGKNFVYIQKNQCIISEVSPESMRDYMTGYVDSINEDISFTYKDKTYEIPPEAIREIYLKNSNNIFNDVWLEHLKIHDEPVLKDSEKEMFFAFRNALVIVSSEGHRVETWNNVNGFCIWEEQVIKHDFDFVEDFTQSHFYKFLKNVTNHDDSRFATMVSGIGYLMHHHFRESEGQAVVFYDETITDTRTPQGGSGKGLIVNGIKQVRNVTKVDGKHLDSTNRFRWEQITPSSQIAWLDDVKPDFDFSILHSNLTDGWTIERKYLSQFTIAPKDSPKTVICSNSIIQGGGSTNKRRQFVIELSNFYSKQIVKGNEKPIEDTHGCIFFSSSWTADDWNQFFSLMVYASWEYLNDGLVSHDGVNVELNRFRQSTNEDFAMWITEQELQPNVRYETKKYFDEFVNIFYGETHQIGQRTFTGWLKEYASYKNLKFETKQSNGASLFILHSI